MQKFQVLYCLTKSNSVLKNKTHVFKYSLSQEDSTSENLTRNLPYEQIKGEKEPRARNCTIIDKEKAGYKIQHLFMKKAHNKLEG